MSKSGSIAVLIVAYRRKDSLREILDLCKLNKIKDIYIAIDGPKINSLVGKNDNFEMNLTVSQFKKKFSGSVSIMKRETNMGCAPSVLSACDWVFEKEDSVIILEDDCIPTSDFFKFSRLTVEIIKSDERVWLSCGTQFMPEDNQMDSWFLSKYPLTWGWCTTKEKWQEISTALKNSKILSKEKVSLEESVYWNAGSRRAQRGWVDVWDTVLAQQLLAFSKLVILPKYNLVSNTGYDDYATNTTESSKRIHTEIGSFVMPNSNPKLEPKVNFWLRTEFFRIRKRHLITTRGTRIKDLLLHFKKPFLPLKDRWLFAESERKSLM